MQRGCHDLTRAPRRGGCLRALENRGTGRRATRLVTAYAGPAVVHATATATDAMHTRYGGCASTAATDAVMEALRAGVAELRGEQPPPLFDLREHKKHQREESEPTE